MMGWCIDCGERTELVLSERFPHICIDCLFPPRRAGEDPTANPPSFMPMVTLVEKLHQLNKATGSIAPGENRMGGG